MSNLKTIIIYTSMIDSLISEFAMNESNRAINEIKKQAKKFMRYHLVKNNKIFTEATIAANRAWISSIDHFAAKDYKIDVYSLINGLWCEQEELFLKYTNLSHKRIEKFLMSSPQDHSTESEMQAYRISSFLIDKIEKEA